MKTGLKYGVAAWVVSLLVMPLLAPFVFHGADMHALGRGWFGLSFILIGIPAFVIGCFQDRKIR